MELAHSLGMGHEARVVVVDAVDVCPNLNFLRLEGHADERGSIVAATTQQVVHLAISVPTDEALGEIDLIARILLHQARKALADSSRSRLAVLVGPHEVEGRKQDGFDACLLEVVDHHRRTDDLALRHDLLLLKTGKEVLGEGAEKGKLLTEKLAHTCPVFLGVEERVDVPHVFLFQRVDNFVGAVGILLVEIVGHLDQLIGRTTHSGEHDEGRTSVTSDETGYRFDSLGTSYGSSTEFHYYHFRS